ncbi:hypothetical protein IC229_33655 [Spirosoma sp. BT702]|uniref:Uncharacterized protein n=1 Tax=Spirosoma profusum TaxID=2771354 RepID=A0A927AW79_9BACT|nr:hypothetical protein [Spirosoma profusum]MBD2705603.1 hypothetical protein [Spirosoma profusum]
MKNISSEIQFILNTILSFVCFGIANLWQRVRNLERKDYLEAISIKGVGSLTKDHIITYAQKQPHRISMVIPEANILHLSDITLEQRGLSLPYITVSGIKAAFVQLTFNSEGFIETIHIESEQS